MNPRPAEPSGDGEQHALKEPIARAIALCGARGVRLTAIRRQVLELLVESARPARAYELIDALKLKNTRPVGPPTVYRALEFLMAQGFVAKIESHNAYVACAHPERHHDCLFFLCSVCGASAEVEDERLEELLAAGADQRRFCVARCVVEVKGTCARCLEPGSR